MTLQEFFSTIKRGSRLKTIAKLANLHGVKVNTLQRWASEKDPLQHPSDFKSVSITEEFTGNAVTRFDLRPDVWNRDDIKDVAQRLNVSERAEQDAEGATEEAQ